MRLCAGVFRLAGVQGDSVRQPRRAGGDSVRVRQPRRAGGDSVHVHHPRRAEQPAKGASPNLPTLGRYQEHQVIHEEGRGGEA